MERKVGEVFTYQGKTYQVVISTKCTNCAFLSCGCPSNFRKVRGVCTSKDRTDKTNVIFKEVKNMEIKNNQLTIEIPKGMEIDLENSDLAKGVVKFKPKSLTYEDILQTLPHSYIRDYGSLVVSNHNIPKLLAISKLMDIAKYYNGDWKPNFNIPDSKKYYIIYDNIDGTYAIDYNCSYIRSNVHFKNKENVLEIISNPNFRPILDAIYKD